MRHHHPTIVLWFSSTVLGTWWGVSTVPINALLIKRTISTFFLEIDQMESISRCGIMKVLRLHCKLHPPWTNETCVTTTITLNSGSSLEADVCAIVVVGSRTRATFRREYPEAPISRRHGKRTGDKTFKSSDSMKNLHWRCFDSIRFSGYTPYGSSCDSTATVHWNLCVIAALRLI